MTSEAHKMEIIKPYPWNLRRTEKYKSDYNKSERLRYALWIIAFFNQLIFMWYGKFTIYMQIWMLILWLITGVYTIYNAQRYHTLPDNGDM